MPMITHVCTRIKQFSLVVFVIIVTFLGNQFPKEDLVTLQIYAGGII